MIDFKSYLPSGPASRQTGEHPATLKTKAKRGDIPYVITPSGRWLFDVAGYLENLAARANTQNS